MPPTPSRTHFDDVMAAVCDRIVADKNGALHGRNDASRPEAIPSGIREAMAPVTG